MNLGLNFKEALKLLFPVQIRGAKNVAWIGALLAPMQSLNALFVVLATGIRYYLGFTGQVGNLEHLLNDQFDDTQRRIYITDPAGTYVFTTFVFNAIEQQPTATIYNTSEVSASATAVLRNLSEVFAAGIDFIVKIPVSLNTSAFKTKMGALINRFKQAGRTYSFENI